MRSLILLWELEIFAKMYVAPLFLDLQYNLYPWYFHCNSLPTKYCQPESICCQDWFKQIMFGGGFTHRCGRVIPRGTGTWRTGIHTKLHSWNPSSLNVLTPCVLSLPHIRCLQDLCMFVHDCYVDASTTQCLYPLTPSSGTSTKSPGMSSI